MWVTTAADARWRAKARSLGVGRGEVVRILFEECDGNFSKLRHDARESLNVIVMGVEGLRLCHADAETMESLAAIARAAADITAMLAKPEEKP